jgi:methylthioribose-1-phosphate isomerase
MSFKTIYFSKGRVVMLDQRELPLKKVYLKLSKHEQVARAIEDMAIRGAPAIGVAAGFGLALAAIELNAVKTPEAWWNKFQKAAKRLAETRPTAVNLFWAIERMSKKASSLLGVSAKERSAELIAEAQAILKEDIVINKRMGANGARLLKSGDTVLTHCNAGALATGGHGTALGVIRSAVKQGKKIKVIADETRPLLQGARLTAWELHEDRIPVKLICDNMAGWMIRNGKVDKIIVGADRIARNGDTANKIGTYSLSVLAHHHQIPFYIAAPLSTIDLKCKDGAQIPIEERDHQEVFFIRGTRIAAAGVECANPAFDVTPASLISAIITEKGVVKKPSANKIGLLFRK